jgi:hypothetical protein
MSTVTGARIGTGFFRQNPKGLLQVALRGHNANAIRETVEYYFRNEEGFAEFLYSRCPLPARGASLMHNFISSNHVEGFRASVPNCSSHAGAGVHSPFVKRIATFANPVGLIP